MKVMFICTGNICRSAMADWMLKSKLKEERIEQVQVFSSGIYAQDGDTSTYEAIEVMKEVGIDLKKHRATNTRNSNIQEMDLILGMTNSHKEELMHMYPNLKDKIFTLKEYVGYNVDGHEKINIKDPWSYGIAVYRFCLSEIEECINSLIAKIKEMNK